MASVPTDFGRQGPVHSFADLNLDLTEGINHDHWAEQASELTPLAYRIESALSAVSRI